MLQQPPAPLESPNKVQFGSCSLLAERSVHPFTLLAPAGNCP
jgi:hypothetical protein